MSNKVNRLRRRRTKAIFVCYDNKAPKNEIKTLTSSFNTTEKCYVHFHSVEPSSSTLGA